MPYDTEKTKRLRELLDEIAAKQAEEIVAKAKATTPIPFGHGRGGKSMMIGTMSGHGMTPAALSTTYNPYAYGRMVNIAVVKPYGWSTYSGTITPTMPTYETIEVMCLGNGYAIDLKTGEIHDTWWKMEERP